MKKKALRKDFFMEVKKSFNRFLSILFIVAMGVAFFSGIRAGEPDIRYSMDAYFDETNLMDLRVMSTLGVTDEDVEALSSIKGIAKAESGYMVDLLCNTDGNQKVMKVISEMDTMNQTQISKGRMPVKSGECVLDKSFAVANGYGVGDQIQLSKEDGSSLEDTLTTGTYNIVGLGSAPMYVSFQRGSSSIGQGEVSGFLIVDKSNFVMEAYTYIDLRLTDAIDKISYTNEYDTIVDAQQIFLEEEVSIERNQIRYDAIYDEADLEIKKAAKELADGEAELADAKVEVEEELAKAWQELVDAEIELEDGKTKIREAKQQVEASKREFEHGKIEIENNRQMLAETEATLLTGKILLEESKQQLVTSQEELDAAILAVGGLNSPTYEAMKEQFFASQLQIDGGLAQIQGQEQEMNSGFSQLEQGKLELEAASIKLAKGEQQLVSATEEIALKEQTILDGEQELEEGHQTYQDEKRKAEQEIAEAEVELLDGTLKLKDAQKELEGIEYPKWHVLTREFFPQYTEGGDNANRIKAIGQVFPVIFFLVAALISLTTMTRMVEEQRTQIGTLKALGYSKFSIAGKFLVYALLATLFGSILGILVGQKVIPYVIITAYQVMYPDIPNVVIPYNLYYGIIAMGAALLCTILATWIACYKELKAQAATLMRPVTPKVGKKIFLERIRFLWIRLSFSQKATIRNMVRYKKRLFMTIFGIGGCMSLMIVGFGLRDSIFAIASLQYDELQLFDGYIIFDEDSNIQEKEAIYNLLEESQKLDGFGDIYMSNIPVATNRSVDAHLVVPKQTEMFEKYTVLRDRIGKTSFQLEPTDVIITEKLAKLLKVQEGDLITLEKGENPKEVTVTKIVENYIYHYVYMGQEIYEQAYGKAIEPNTIQFTTTTRTKNDIRNLGEQALQMDAVLNVSYLESAREQVDDMLKSLNVVLVVLIFSAGMLAFIVLYNLNNININERKRELASIKVLGFYNGELAAYVYRENILLTIAGMGFGILLGNILHRYIIVTVEIDSTMFGREVMLLSYIYSMAFTCFFALFVNWVMYFKLKKIDMIESLKSVE